MRYALALTEIDSNGRIRRYVINSGRKTRRQWAQTALLLAIIMAGACQTGWSIADKLAPLIGQN